MLGGSCLLHGCPTGGGGGTVVDPTRYMTVGEHFRYDGQSITTAAGTLDQIVRLAIVTPKWACKNPRFVFAGSFGKETATNPETAVGNSYTIEGAVIETTRGTTKATLAFSSSATATVASGTNQVISDAPGITIPANSSAGSTVANYFLVVDINVASSGQFMPGYLPSPLTGEASVQSATTQTAKLTSSTSLGNNFAPNAAFAPVTVLCQGWDGSPVVQAAGDSICEGKGDRLDTTRGLMGYIARGLDDAASGSLANTNWCVSSTSPGATSEGAITAGNYGDRIAIINAVAALNANSALPFTTILVEHGTNTAVPNTADPAFWSIMHTQFPGVPVLQATLTPHWDASNAALSVSDSACTAADSVYCWTDTTHTKAHAVQYNPSGVVTTFNANLITPGTYDCHTLGGTCEDGVVDITPYAWTNQAACFAGTATGCTWFVPPFTTTIAAGGTGTAGNAFACLTAQPAIGDDLAFDGGTTSTEATKSGGGDAGGFTVTTITGPNCGTSLAGYTVNFTGALQFNHAAASAVAEDYTNSGLHPNVPAAIAMSNAVIAAKLAGTIH